VNHKAEFVQELKQAKGGVGGKEDLTQNRAASSPESYQSAGKSIRGEDQGTKIKGPGTNTANPGKGKKKCRVIIRKRFP